MLHSFFFLSGSADFDNVVSLVFNLLTCSFIMWKVTYVFLEVVVKLKARLEWSNGLERLLIVSHKSMGSILGFSIIYYWPHCEEILQDDQSTHKN